MCAFEANLQTPSLPHPPPPTVRLHTSVWKSPSDESGVLAEEESQFLLCSSMRSFCSPGTMDSSGVMFLKLSQELWPSGFDLSWWRRRRWEEKEEKKAV